MCMYECDAVNSTLQQGDEWTSEMYDMTGRWVVGGGGGDGGVMGSVRASSVIDSTGVTPLSFLDIPGINIAAETCKQDSTPLRTCVHIQLTVQETLQVLDQLEAQYILWLFRPRR